MNPAHTNNSAADTWDLAAQAASVSPMRKNNNFIDGTSIEESTSTAVATAVADVATLKDAIALAMANDTLEETTVATTATAFESLTTAAAYSLAVADATLLPTTTVTKADQPH